jgi:Fe2+ or Zn2+ uptake regulation protein
LQNSKPATSKEIHYQVKAVNLNVSFNCIYQTLALLVDNGLASEIIPEGHSARLYTHELTIAQLVCKDCERRSNEGRTGSIISGQIHD